MIPIRDTIPARRTAWVVRLLVAVNVAVFLVELWQHDRLDAWLYHVGVVPAAWVFTGPEDFLRGPWLLVTLVTSQFLHGSALHLGLNMLYLWIFGDNVEDRLGHGRFAVLYVGSGAAAALIQLLIQPNATAPMIGASGAIAGVLGAYFLLFPFARITTLIPLIVAWPCVELPAFVFLGVWFGMQWLQGMTALGEVATVGGIAWWAHIGGFATGLVLLAGLRVRQRHW